MNFVLFGTLLCVVVIKFCVFKLLYLFYSHIYIYFFWERTSVAFINKKTSHYRLKVQLEGVEEHPPSTLKNL